MQIIIEKIRIGYKRDLTGRLIDDTRWAILVKDKNIWGLYGSYNDYSTARWRVDAVNDYITRNKTLGGFGVKWEIDKFKERKELLKNYLVQHRL